MTKHEIILTEEKIKEAIAATISMGAAANYLKIDWRTFKKNAKKFNLYSPNRTGGWNKKININDILNGKFPNYPTSHLSKRLIKENIKEYKCECCGISEWNNKRISLELNHINGNKDDHSLANLELLCPNPTSQVH